jgi:hypothetical protein
MPLQRFVDEMLYAQVWLGSVGRGGVILLGGNSPWTLDRAQVRRRLADPRVRRDLAEFNDEYKTEGDFEKLYEGTGARFAEYLRGTPEVTDEFPRIEYPYFRSREPDHARAPEILNWPAVPVDAVAGS